MKVICKCCHKAFDYDMYMGLCPKCGRVYRRGKEHYSVIEKDMMGEFHLHADEGGLNRGIHGVVYNQGSTSEKEVMNRASKATINRELGEPNEAENPFYSSTAKVMAETSGTGRPVGSGAGAGQSYARQVNTQAGNASKTAFKGQGLDGAAVREMVAELNNTKGQNYYGADHQTRMNQGSNGKVVPFSVKFIFVVVCIIIGFFLSLLD